MIRAIVLLFVAAAAALAIGFAAFAAGVSSASPPADPRAEGIVVLTGGSARIDGALHLLGRRPRRPPADFRRESRPSAPAELADTVDPRLTAMLACCVDLGRDARDTIGNASETRDWAAEHGYRSLIVVTSAYHMPRSIAELNDAMPGVTLIPYPVSNPELRLEAWWHEPQPLLLLAREYGKYLLAEARLLVATPAAQPATAQASSS